MPNASKIMGKFPGMESKSEAEEPMGAMKKGTINGVVTFLFKLYEMLRVPLPETVKSTRMHAVLRRRLRKTMKHEDSTCSFEIIRDILCSNPFFNLLPRSLQLHMQAWRVAQEFTRGPRAKSFDGVNPFAMLSDLTSAEETQAVEVAMEKNRIRLEKLNAELVHDRGQAENHKAAMNAAKTDAERLSAEQSLQRVKAGIVKKEELCVQLESDLEMEWSLLETMKDMIPNIGGTEQQTSSPKTQADAPTEPSAVERDISIEELQEIFRKRVTVDGDKSKDGMNLMLCMSAAMTASASGRALPHTCGGYATRAAAVIGRTLRKHAAHVGGDNTLEFHDFLRLLVMRPWKRLLPMAVANRVQEYLALQEQLHRADEGVEPTAASS